MALKTKFVRVLDDAVDRRTEQLRRLVVSPNQGAPKKYTRTIRDRLKKRILLAASAVLVNEHAENEIAKTVVRRRLRFIKGFGLTNRFERLYTWAERKLDGPIVYAFWRGNLEKPQVRECGGKSRLKGRFLGCLEELQNPAWRIDLAIAIRDSDCSPPQPIEERLRDILNASKLRPQFRVEIFAVPCMLESWLISDLRAIRKVAAQRGHGGAIEELNVQISNAHSPDDKNLFIRVLKHFSLPATAPVYKEVATIADFDVIRERCRYFREFVRRIAA